MPKISWRNCLILWRNRLPGWRNCIWAAGGCTDTQSILELLRTEQTKYLEFCRQPDITEEKIEAYAQEHLQPVYDTALRQTESVILTAQEKKVGYGITAERLRLTNLIGSIVLMILMVGVLLISQYVLQRQRKELVYRSRLFDDLSLSIDDAFIIRDANTGDISYRGLNLERVLGIPMQARKASTRVSMRWTHRRSERASALLSPMPHMKDWWSIQNQIKKNTGC